MKEAAKIIVILIAIFIGKHLIDFFVLHSMCTQDVVAEKVSPSSLLKAVEVHRSCGAPHNTTHVLTMAPSLWPFSILFTVDVCGGGAGGEFDFNWISGWSLSVESKDCFNRDPFYVMKVVPRE